MVDPKEYPTEILIAGKRWSVRPLTRKKIEETLGKPLEKKIPLNHISGMCHGWSKTILIDYKKHPEEVLDTFLHEVIHAVASEHSENDVMMKLLKDEDATVKLCSELLGVLKQAKLLRS